MKHLFACLFLLSASQAAAQGRIPCNQWSFVHNASATSMTQFITSSDPTRQIGICGYVLVASSNAATFQLAYGTGANCSIGQVPLSPVIGLGNGASLVNRNPDVVERVPAGQNLCAASTGSGTIDAIVYWTIF